MYSIRIKYTSDKTIAFCYVTHIDNDGSAMVSNDPEDAGIFDDDTFERVSSDLSSQPNLEVTKYEV